MKRIIVVILMIFIFLTPVLAQTKVSGEIEIEKELFAEYITDNHVLATENSLYELWINVDVCQIILREKTSGREWLSTPSEIDKEESISRGMKEQMKSNLLISFIDSSRNIITVNSFAESINDGTYEVVKLHNGIKITYDFTKENLKFKIPMQITLGADYMEATLLYDEIKEYGTSKITSIDLLPYWGTGRENEIGYLFIPDGSGALVNFSDNSRNSDPWRQRVYGADPAVDLMLKSVDAPEMVTMPVFGIKKGNGAFFAVIDQGDTAASIYASNSSINAPFASVGSSFIFHQYDITGLRNKSGNSSELATASVEPIHVTPSVRYYFLEEDNADYSGMARKYRTYLEKTQGLTISQGKDSPVTSLMFYGMTKKSANFLGIPITKKVVATTFSDIKIVLKRLREIGLGTPNVFLYGFEKGGYQYSYSKKETFDSGVGGKKGYLTLLNEEKKANIYEAGTFTRNYDGITFFSNNKYIRSLNSLDIKRWMPMSSTGDWDFTGASWRYFRPNLLIENTKRWLNSITKADNAGVLMVGIGSELYSDFSVVTDPGRDRTMYSYTQTMKAVKDKIRRVAGEGGNVYQAATAEILTGIPTTSSCHDIISEDIPFYAITLHAYVQLTSKPVNRDADIISALPYMIAAGIQPSWQLTAVDSVKLNNTKLSFLYNTKADDWLDMISAAAREYASVQAGLANVPIFSHMEENELEIFTYENGIVLVANPSDTVKSYKGKSIPAGKILVNN